MSVAKSSMLMAGGTVISRILGFVRAVVTAAAIGVTTNAADAFGVANQLPNNVYAIIAGGTLNAVLVPQLVRARTQKDGGTGYINRLLTFIITVFFGITLLATMAAPALVAVYTQGWSSQQLALATAFAYWCLPQLFFYGLYSLLGEVLNSRSAFGPFMWAPVLNNVVQLAGLIGFVILFGNDPTGVRAVDQWGPDQIAWLAGTSTLGVASQALILLTAWKKLGIKLTLNFKWRGFGLRPALKAASWSLGMVLVTQVGGLVQTIVASGAVSARADNPGVASVAAAGIAWLVFMLPHSVATVSIATAYFTKMSHHVHQDRIDLLKADLAAGLRAIALISVLATVGISVLAFSVARVFVGEFAGIVALGNVIIALMIGLLPFSFVYMMQRAFFALEDTKTPFWFTVIQIGLHIIGAITIALTVSADWLVVSLSLLTSSTLIIQAVVAFGLLTRRIGSFKGLGIASSVFKFVISGVIAGGIGYALLQQLGGVADGSFAVAKVVSAGLTMVIVGGVIAAVYFVALRLLKVSEVDTVLQAAKGIIRR